MTEKIPRKISKFEKRLDTELKKIAFEDYGLIFVLVFLKAFLDAYDSIEIHEGTTVLQFGHSMERSESST